VDKVTLRRKCVIEGKDRQSTKGQVSEGAWEERMVDQEQETTGGGVGVLGTLSGGAGSMDGMMEGAVILNSVNLLGIPVLHVRRYCVLLPPCLLG
jgi:hypothetical protein